MVVGVSVLDRLCFVVVRTGEGIEWLEREAGSVVGEQRQVVAQKLSLLPL